MFRAEEMRVTIDDEVCRVRMWFDYISRLQGMWPVRT
jgi:hypothetical protein